MLKMHMSVKVPEVEACCGCVPLRAGIIVSGCMNILFSLLAVVFLVLSSPAPAEQELLAAAAQYGLLGMAVILNVLLLLAGIQSDLQMLRLYSYYAVATTLAAAAPAALLLARMRYYELGAAVLAIGLQCYVIVVVRSEILQLEQQLQQQADGRVATAEEVIDVPDDESLI